MKRALAPTVHGDDRCCGALDDIFGQRHRHHTVIEANDRDGRRAQTPSPSGPGSKLGAIQKLERVEVMDHQLAFQQRSCGQQALLRTNCQRSAFVRQRQARLTCAKSRRKMSTYGAVARF